MLLFSSLKLPILDIERAKISISYGTNFQRHCQLALAHSDAPATPMSTAHTDAARRARNRRRSIASTPPCPSSCCVAAIRVAAKQRCQVPRKPNRSKIVTIARTLIAQGRVVAVIGNDTEKLASFPEWVLYVDRLLSILYTIDIT